MGTRGTQDAHCLLMCEWGLGACRREVWGPGWGCGWVADRQQAPPSPHPPHPEGPFRRAWAVQWRGVVLLSAPWSTRDKREKGSGWGRRRAGVLCPAAAPEGLCDVWLELPACPGASQGSPGPSVCPSPPTWAPQLSSTSAVRPPDRLPSPVPVTHLVGHSVPGSQRAGQVRAGVGVWLPGLWPVWGGVGVGAGAVPTSTATPGFPWEALTLPHAGWCLPMGAAGSVTVPPATPG